MIPANTSCTPIQWCWSRILALCVIHKWMVTRITSSSKRLLSLYIHIGDAIPVGLNMGPPEPTPATPNDQSQSYKGSCGSKRITSFCQFQQNSVGGKVGSQYEQNISMAPQQHRLLRAHQTCLLLTLLAPHKTKSTQASVPYLQSTPWAVPRISETT